VQCLATRQPRLDRLLAAVVLDDLHLGAHGVLAVGVRDGDVGRAERRHRVPFGQSVPVDAGERKTVARHGVRAGHRHG
jgi:hypothetical protein